MTKKEALKVVPTGPDGKPIDPTQKPEIPTRRAKMLMVNPADFMFLFTKGLEFKKKTRIIKGIPDDAELLTIAAEPVRGGVMMVVQSETYDEIPINEMPPVEVVSIDVGDKSATKKKKAPRKKKK